MYSSKYENRKNGHFQISLTPKCTVIKAFGGLVIYVPCYSWEHYQLQVQSAQKNLAGFFYGREKSCGPVNTQPIKMIFSGSLNEGKTEPSKKN